MGKGVVDPVLCELCALPRTAPKTSAPLLPHRDVEREGYNQNYSVGGFKMRNYLLPQLRHRAASKKVVVTEDF